MSDAASLPALISEDEVFAIERPDPVLLRYYRLSSLFWGPAFFIPLVWNSLRYRTIRYHFNREGITMRWGGLERREVSVAYRRIQDIHLSTNLLERWLGLARLEIQTASGDANAELTLEGLPSPRAVRDFLLLRSRDIRPTPPAVEAAPAGDAALAEVLTDIATELRTIRQLLTPTKDAPSEAQEP
jgi:putative membrane protein